MIEIEYTTIMIAYLIGFALGWAFHSARSAATPQPIRILKTLNMDQQSLIILYSILKKITIKVKRNPKRADIIKATLAVIANREMSIERGVKLLKKYKIPVPSQDAILRLMHLADMRTLEKGVMDMLREIIAYAREMKLLSRKIIVAVDTMNISYYGHMGHTNASKFKKALKFVERSSIYVHKGKDGMYFKYLTASIANSKLSGLLIWLSPIKSTESIVDHVARFLEFYKDVLKIHMLLMDRGFYNRSIYRLCKRYNVKVLTPAPKTSGMKQMIIKELGFEELIDEADSLVSMLNEILSVSGKGRGYKNLVQLKKFVSGVLFDLSRAETLAAVMSVLERLNDIPCVPRIKDRIFEIKRTAELLTKYIKNPPRIQISEYTVGGKGGVDVFVAIVLSNDRYSEQMKIKFTGKERRLSDILRCSLVKVYYLFVSGDMENLEKRRYQVYRRRWAVETAHRMLRSALSRTTTNDVVARYFLAAVSLAVYDVWVLARKESEELVYEPRFREFREDIRESFYVFVLVWEGVVEFEVTEVITISGVRGIPYKCERESWPPPVMIAI